MKKLKLLTLMFAFAAMTFTACEDATDPDPIVETPDPVTNLVATSKSATEVTLKWDASPSEIDALFEHYIIDISSAGGGPLAPEYVQAGTNMITITNLTEGEIYTFEVTAKFTNGELSAVNEIIWSPASRFNTDAFELPINLYEKTSEFGSGLDFYNENDGGPRNLAVSGGEDWDIGLVTDAQGTLKIACASLIDNNFTTDPVSTTEFATTVIEAESLDEVFDSMALDQKTFAAAEVDLNTYSSSIVIIARTKMPEGEWHYAKIFVEYDATEGFFRTDNSLTNPDENQYVVLKMSYQMGDNVPYAKISQSNGAK